MDLLIDIWNGVAQSGVLADADEMIKQVNGIEQSAGEIKKAASSVAKDLKPDKESGFLGMPIYDKDLLKLVFRFFINMLSILVVVRFIYYPIAKRKDYLFTYIMIALITFFICFTLKKFDLGLGMALGLFAIFGIIRYRTDPIPIKEMTYLFIIIGMSVINALANKKMSYAELAFTNGVIMAVTFGLERIWLLKHEAYKSIVYERIGLVKADKYDDLIADLEERTGLKINRVEVGKIDFLRDVANLKIYYYAEEQDTPQFEDKS